MRDPYSVLGVPRSADDAEIKSAFRKLAKKFHPDAHQGDAAMATRFQEVSDAYALIRDAAARRKFDQQTRPRADAAGATRTARTRARQTHAAYGANRPFEETPLHTDEKPGDAGHENSYQL